MVVRLKPAWMKIDVDRSPLRRATTASTAPSPVRAGRNGQRVGVAHVVDEGEDHRRAEHGGDGLHLPQQRPEQHAPEQQLLDDRGEDHRPDDEQDDGGGVAVVLEVGQELLVLGLGVELEDRKERQGEDDLEDGADDQRLGVPQPDHQAEVARPCDFWPLRRVT